MKCFSTASIALLLVAASAIQTTQALKKYLDNIPNGASFAQALGHPDSDETKFTDFATAFQAVDLTWTTEFCKATFAGSTMTNGAAFGDPCCTWKKGATPDNTVTAFTTTPTKATTCATATTPAPATTTATPAATTATPASTTVTPAATTAAPSTDDSDSASSAGSSTTPAPAATTATPTATTTKPSSGTGSAGGKGCTIKKNKGKGSKGKGSKGKGGKGGKKFRGSGSGSTTKNAGSAY